MGNMTNVDLDTMKSKSNSTTTQRFWSIAKGKEKRQCYKVSESRSAVGKDGIEIQENGIKIDMKSENSHFLNVRNTFSINT